MRLPQIREQTVRPVGGQRPVEGYHGSRGGLRHSQQPGIGPQRGRGGPARIFRGDLAFILDVQMPGCSGMEVASALPVPRPKIVFCTAFEQYEVEAFELAAVDYLLKPVSRSRLARALERVRTGSAAETDSNVERFIRSPKLTPTRFLGRRGQRFRVIPQKEVAYVGSEGGLTKLYTSTERYVMEPTLSDFERRLRPPRILQDFSNCHRQSRLRL